MKAIKLLAAVGVVVITSACVIKNTTDWKVKEGYTVKVFRNAQIQYPIYFKGLKADISFDQEHPEKSSIKATIDATTVDTGVALMTEHAKEESVLHTAKYPVITFQSNSVRKKDIAYEITGSLTMKGITKAVTFPFTFENETFVGAFSILAKDFNITRNGAVPSGEIKIELTIPVVK